MDSRVDFGFELLDYHRDLKRGSLCLYFHLQAKFKFAEISCLPFIYFFSDYHHRDLACGSVLFLRYRDINQIWEVLMQVGSFHPNYLSP